MAGSPIRRARRAAQAAARAAEAGAPQLPPDLSSLDADGLWLKGSELIEQGIKGNDPGQISSGTQLRRLALIERKADLGDEDPQQDLERYRALADVAITKAVSVGAILVARALRQSGPDAALRELHRLRTAASGARAARDRFMVEQLAPQRHVPYPDWRNETVD